MRKMKLTKREEFLLETYAYLRNGSNGFLEDEGKERTCLTDEEVRDIMLNKERIYEIDVLDDELDYHGLSLDDFEWVEDEEEELTVGELIEHLKSYKQDTKILIEDSDGLTSNPLSLGDIQDWVRDEQVDGVSTGKDEHVVMFSKFK